MILLSSLWLQNKAITMPLFYVSTKGVVCVFRNSKRDGKRVEKGSGGRN